MVGVCMQLPFKANKENTLKMCTEALKVTQSLRPKWHPIPYIVHYL